MYRYFLTVYSNYFPRGIDCSIKCPAIGTKGSMTDPQIQLKKEYSLPQYSNQTYKPHRISSLTYARTTCVYITASKQSKNKYVTVR